MARARGIVLALEKKKFGFSFPSAVALKVRFRHYLCRIWHLSVSRPTNSRAFPCSKKKKERNKKKKVESCTLSFYGLASCQMLLVLYVGELSHSRQRTDNITEFSFFFFFYYIYIKKRRVTQSNAELTMSASVIV